jgi:hypothetical protein
MTKFSMAIAALALTVAMDAGAGHRSPVTASVGDITSGIPLDFVTALPESTIPELRTVGFFPGSLPGVFQCDWTNQFNRPWWCNLPIFRPVA